MKNRIETAKKLVALASKLSKTAKPVGTKALDIAFLNALVYSCKTEGPAYRSSMFKTLSDQLNKLGVHDLAEQAMIASKACAKLADAHANDRHLWASNTDK